MALTCTCIYRLASCVCGASVEEMKDPPRETVVVKIGSLSFMVFKDAFDED